MNTGDRLMTSYDEEHLGELLSALPPAPAAWVQGCERGRRSPGSGSTRSSSAQGRTSFIVVVSSPTPNGRSSRRTWSRTPTISRSSASGSTRNKPRGAGSKRIAPCRSRAIFWTSRSAIFLTTSRRTLAPAAGSAAAIAVAMAAGLIAKSARASPDWATGRRRHRSGGAAPPAHRATRAERRRCLPGGAGRAPPPKQLESEVRDMALGQVLARAAEIPLVIAEAGADVACLAP